MSDLEKTNRAEKMPTVVIGVDAPYAEMIINGTSIMLVADRITPSLEKLRHKEINEVKLYIYHQTLGNVIGEVIATNCFFVNYKGEQAQKKKSGTEYVKERNEMVKELYFQWCKKNGVKINKKDGWFKSKKFFAYMDTIGVNKNDYNYGIIVCNPKKYETPLSIDKFGKR